MTAELKRSERLWFSPEVVVLRAQGQVFRVFVAILKEKSTVFADMFTFPQPSCEPSDIETMEGVPVVTLHDDPAEVEVFLKAIFDSNFFMPPPSQSKVQDTLGILRLAHKYDVPYLRRRALEHLGTIYPTLLSEYKESTPSEILSTLDERLAAIGAATEVGALWLLPAAYHAICQYGLSGIMENKGWLALGEQDRKTYILGSEAQIRQFPTVLSFLSVSKQPGDDSCADPAKCNRSRLRLNGLHSLMSARKTPPLDTFNERRWQTMGRGICDSCVEEAKTIYASARQKFWYALPEMFGLPSWEELEQMREAAFSS
ncbi:hypothetical protein DFH06DRAFT_996980 [Mycena polygramma]|nr:hypothetical protein DFH06DRAFT_996980 [Mycena polygramma]